MLYSTEMRLKIMSASNENRVTGRHILSLFSRLIENVNPTLSEELHRDSAVKPFTLSPLLPLVGRHKSAMKEGDTTSFRITVLDERVFTALMDAIWRLSPDYALTLGNMRVRCQSLATTPAQSTWAGFTSFKQLMENAGKDTSLRLEFLSPTTFRSSGRGERNILFPEPGLVFGSLLKRWNTFAESSLKLDLPESAIGSIRVSGYRLATRLLEFVSYRELGFVGMVTYECPYHLSEASLLALNALADYAFYAGTGAKTTMGMGQTRRTPAARSLSGRKEDNGSSGGSCHNNFGTH